MTKLRQDRLLNQGRYYAVHTDLCVEIWLIDNLQNQKLSYDFVANSNKMTSPT